ncbi:MAG: NAD(+) kinase [Proteobacteria bacterium]|nr:MAG: NAD(+) kinase [Pseudomonadota bacterium]
MRSFSRIGLFSKQQDTRIAATLHKLYQFLTTQSFAVSVTHTVASFLAVEGVDNEHLADNIDLAIVVGGDGTLLKVGRLLAPKGIPIIGINLGRLGFLVDISSTNLDEQLQSILDGQYTTEARTLLQAEVFRDDELLGSGNALNDVTVHVRNDVRMIEFDTTIDGYFVNTQRADGMIISTPTGSTAYSLSAGGPILHPSLGAVTLVPICPHTLSHRPIVVSSESSIEILLCESRNVDARVSFDGQSNLNLRAGDRIVIRQHPNKLLLIHPVTYDYYHILRTKLGWSTTPP